MVVGSFTTETNANAFRDKLLAAGLPAEIIPFHKQNQTWYRVRSGRFAEKAEAEDYIRDLKRKNLVDSTYVLDLGRS
ncbi:MAG: SPOR domain-containing protein [Deltaproteobacteria bacterium]|nr:SPOR domain-containing protein [Deltaproteobacteria bacterium]